MDVPGPCECHRNLPGTSVMKLSSIGHFYERFIGRDIFVRLYAWGWLVPFVVLGVMCVEIDPVGRTLAYAVVVVASAIAALALIGLAVAFAATIRGQVLVLSASEVRLSVGIIRRHLCVPVDSVVLIDVILGSDPGHGRGILFKCSGGTEDAEGLEPKHDHHGEHEDRTVFMPQGHVGSNARFAMVVRALADKYRSLCTPQMLELSEEGFKHEDVERRKRRRPSRKLLVLATLAYMAYVAVCLRSSGT